MFKRELIDIDDADALRRAIEAVSEDGEPRFLRRGDSVIALLTVPRPRRATRPRRRRSVHATHGKQPRTQPFTLDDPLWKVVGIFEGAGPTDVSEHKHEYLAEAYEEEFE